MWSTDHRHCIVCLWSVDHIEVYDQLVCLWSVDHIDQPSSNPFLPTAMQPGEFWLHASACRQLHPLNKVKESHVSYQQSRQMHVPRTLQVALLLEERGWMMAPCSPLLASTCVRRYKRRTRFTKNWEHPRQTEHHVWRKWGQLHTKNR